MKRIERDEVRRLMRRARTGRRGAARRRYEDEHIAGGISIPLKELDEKARRLLDRGRAVIASCYE